MNIVICPKCKSPNDDALDDGNWQVCAICHNRWLPSADVPDVRSTPRVQHVTTPTARDFIARTASGEYLPEEPGTDQVKRALTERVEGRQSGLQPAIAGVPAARAIANQLPPLDPPMRETIRPSLEGQESPVRAAMPERKLKASHSPETGRTIDSDLFDLLEEEARYKRSEMKTVPELSYSDPDKLRTAVPHSDHSAKVTCPVCGHSYGSQGSHHTCPQCGTAYDEDSQRIAAGAGAKDNLIGRNLRGCLIDRKLGEGGMGAVYHAKQLSLDRSVAVKVLPVDLARNKNFIQRFEREAKSLARINHPNILQIYDFGDDPQLGLYFMVIEFVEGLDLGEVLNRRGLLGQIEVLDLLRQAVSGLEAAAEKGVIHRDIKPDNLMIGTNGLVKVSDFGLAKGYVAQVGVTAAGVRVGTPAFMSPEQCDGVEVDYRSDVYNLGATAFLCLAGRLPFDGETPFAIMLKHKTEAVPSLCDIDPTIDRRVDRLISRLLAKKPDQRCESLRELLEQIENLETQLAGTESVLRKSRGPFRAILSGGPPMPTVVLADDAASESPGPLPPLEQVELVDLPPAPPLPPAVASRGQAAAARRHDSSSGNLRRGIEMPAALPPTPLEVATIPPTLDKGAQRASRRLDLELQQARERGRRSQLEAVIANADRLADDGSFVEAAAAWTAAADLASSDSGLRKDLLKRARGARLRSSAKRFLRVVLTLALVLISLLAVTWFGTPDLHNWLVRQRLQMLTDGFANVTPRQQITELRGFAASNNAPWDWYVSIFRRTYQVGASDQAIHLAENLERQPVQQEKRTGKQSGPEPEIAAVLASAQDPQVSWDVVAQQARALLAAVKAQNRDPTPFARVSEALNLAEAELALQAGELQKIATARAAGDHEQALRLAEAFRARHPRATTSFANLPLPASVRIEVSAIELPNGLTLQVDGVAVALRPAVPGESGASAVEAVFCRNGDRETVIEAQAEGFTTQRLTLPGSTSSVERALSMAMSPATAWGISFANPAINATLVAWAGMHPIANGKLVLQHRDGVLVLRQTDGAVLARAERLVPASPGFSRLWLPVDAKRMLMAREDGTVDLIGSATLIPEQTLHRGKGEVLAWTDLDLIMQNGKQIHAVIERTATETALIAQDPAREYWRYARLKVVNQTPMILRHDDRLFVFDDASLHLLEEDGTVVRVFNLPAARNGMPVEIAFNGHRELLVPTTAGVQRLQLGNHQAPVRSAADPVLAGLGPVQVVVDQDQLLTVSDQHVTLLACKPTSAIVWQQEQSRPLGALPTISRDRVIVIDDQGLITVRDRANGKPVQRIAHGTPVCGPAAVISLAEGQALLVADRSGKASAYPLRP